jgi:hypothetical protein
MSFTGYYQVMDELTEDALFKRLVAWKGLKIRYISINGSTISIECYKGKKTYFITITEYEVKVFNNKKECIDVIHIPKQYIPPSTITTTGPWVTYTTDHTVTSDPKWRSAGTTLDPQYTTTSNNTAASYREFKIDFE